MSQFFRELTWDQIRWPDQYKQVRRSQRRIFKASQKGDVRTVRYLQQRLIRSPHAKVIAVQQVTTLNKGKKTPGVDGFVPTNSSMKLTLAKNLQLNGKASPIKRVWIPKPGKEELRPLGIPTIQDRAKQALAKLALEPEWEARFEANSYGFRPGRSCHDAIEAIYINLRHGVDKLVYDADIRKCFDRINHAALLEKMKTFPLLKRQIQAWLQAGIMEEFAETPRESVMGTPQGGVISPLLANIALHGLEDHLKEFVSKRDFPKPHSRATTGKVAKQAALGVVRYADDFVIIHQNPEIMQRVIERTKEWLVNVGLEISEEKSKLRWASQSFVFLGFQIALVNRNGKTRTKITPSKESVKRLTQKVRGIIQANKSASSYSLIYLLRPILIGWANYYQYCECKETFKQVDNIVYQQLRAWVLRRAVRKGRKETMRKYFLANREYQFQNRTYRSNWIFSGNRVSKSGIPVNAYLPKISWVSSEKFVKIRSTASVYDGNDLYWGRRNPQYSTLSTRVCNLLRRQGMKCRYCQKDFQPGDTLEVDHIVPRSQGGSDQYTNLQLLHRYCHVQKTRDDRSKERFLDNFAGAG